jgi:hypothetical protein
LTMRMVGDGERGAVREGRREKRASTRYASHFRR